MPRPLSYLREEGYVDVHVRMRKSDHDLIRLAAFAYARPVSTFMRETSLELAQAVCEERAASPLAGSAVQ